LGVREWDRGYDSRMGPERIITGNAAEFAERAASWIADTLVATIEQRGSCSLALTGGSTPGPVYRRLAGQDGISWGAVSVYFSDERAVPPEHPQSNYRLAVDTLLSRIAVLPGQIHRMEAERPDRDRAAREYEALLPERLDLLLLGVGADGHTASLFPHAPTLAETGRRVVPAMGGVPRLARLTITPPVIAAARRLLVMARGPDKAAAVAGALAADADPVTLPARLASRGTWILDCAAAAALSEAAP
jgi:6-phosphogluconolactonase